MHTKGVVGSTTTPPRHWVVFSLLIATTALCSPILARAEEPPLPLPSPAEALPTDAIVTDRPTVSVSPVTVEPLRLQVEAAAFDISRASASDSSFTMPFKLRFGVAPRLELDVESSGLAVALEQPNEATNRVGFSDVDLGFKTTMVDGDGAVPILGLQMVVSLPSGTGDFSANSYRLTPTLLAAWALGSFGLGANFGVTSSICEEQNRVDTARWSAVLSRTWKPLNARLASFLEVFGEAPFCRSDATFSVDAGTVWLVTPYLQLDFAVRAGLNSQAADVGGTMGVSLKI